MILRPNFNLTKSERCFDTLFNDLQNLFNLLDYNHPSYLKLKCEDEDFDQYSDETANEITKTYSIINSAGAANIFEECVDTILEDLIFIGDETNLNDDDIELTISVNTREFILLVRAVVFAVEEGKTKKEVFDKIQLTYKNVGRKCEYLQELKKIYNEENKVKNATKNIWNK